MTPSVSSPRRAALYARFSTDLQRDASIDDQFALCRRYCEREGIAVVDEFHDRAVTSASMIGRAGVQSLLAAIGRRRFDCIVVENVDRLSRDMADLGLIWRECQFHRVTLLTVHEGEASTLSIGLRGVMGAMFLTDLKHKIRRGMSGKVTAGQRAGGLPYGYRAVAGKPGELEIDPERALTVRRIFEWYADGWSPREIALALNREGVPAPRGGAWQSSSISGYAARGQGMIMNEFYAGEIVWNKTEHARNPKTGKRVPRVNPPESWMRAPAPDLAIVSKELFEAVRAAQERRRLGAHGVPKRPKRLLSGLLKCGECGSSIVSSGLRNGHPVAICSRAKETGTCDNRGKYRVDRIEESVINLLRSNLSNPRAIAEAARAYREERRRLAADTVRERSQMERRRGEAQRELDRLVDGIAKGIMIVEIAGPKTTELYREIQAISQRLAQEDEPGSNLELHPKAIEQYLTALSKIGTGDILDLVIAEKIRELILTIVLQPREEGEAIEFELRGRLAHLVQPVKQVDGVRAVGMPLGGGRPVVAEEGLEPPTPGL